jgi:hypothetical protein
MEVVTMESPAFKELVTMFGKVCKTCIELASENNALKSKRLFTAQEVSNITGYNEKTIRLKKHEIGFRSEGGQLMFKPEDVDAWIERGYVAPKAIKYISR